MKIRNGFVTNSSSTSYILNSVSTGRFEKLNMQKIKECVENMKDYKISYFRDGYISVIKDINHEYDCKELNGYVEFIFSDMIDFKDNDDYDNYFTMGTIYVRSSELWKKDELFCIEEIKEVLNGISEAIPKDYILNFSYVQMPIKEIGDGWNGGDTEDRPYKFIDDLYNTESKHGFITLLNGKVDTNIISIGNEINFLKYISGLKQI
jgi:hypothetical protein